MSKKPEAWIVAEESHWKLWKYKDIISKEVEDDHLRLRRELGNFQEKFRQQERLYKAVKAELATERAAKSALQKALDSATEQLEQSTKRRKMITDLARDLYRRNKSAKQRIKRLRESLGGDESGALKMPCQTKMQAR